MNQRQVSAMVEELKSALFSANNNVANNPTSLLSGIKRCDKVVRIINGQLKNPLSLGMKNHLHANLGIVHSFRKMFKALQVVGSGYKPTQHTAKHRIQWLDQQSAFVNRMRTGVVVNLSHKDVGSFMDDAFIMFRRRINNIMKTEEALKVNATFCGEFEIVKSDQEVLEFKYLSSKYAAIYRDTNLSDWFATHIKQSILVQLQEFQERDSGWALYSIVNLIFNINKYMPMRVGTNIDLPESIKKKQACINVKNDDDACFAWAITSALYPAQHNSDRTSSYPHYSTVLDMKKITMPMTLKQIPRFEAQNNVSVNIYIMKKLKNNQFEVLPIYLTKNKQHRHINLLLVQDKYYNEEEEDDCADENDDCKPCYHYVWIKDLSRLVSNQFNKHNGKMHICDRCMNYFYTARKLEEHMKDCINLNECKLKLPREHEKQLKFTNFKNKEKVPYVIYADIECLLEPVEDKNKYQRHIPCSIGYYVKCSYDDSLSFYRSHTGADCQEWFVKELAQYAEDVEPTFFCPRSMDPLTIAQAVEFNIASCCHICEGPFKPEDKRVRDHCHFTGKYRGPAHNECNLKYQDNITVPVVFHNLSGYDSHFIIKNLAKDIEGRIELLPINKEKYISFTKHITENKVKFRFIDSFKFMASSLEKLASYLTEYPVLKSEFLHLTEEQMALLTRKGIYPYEYMDSWERMNETELPNISKFYSKLNDSGITNEDYVHAQNVWEKMECKNLREYTELYLQSDILLLSDVFEEFRNTCYATHGLDPANYHTLPGFTWDAMLKYTKVNLELLTDIDMILFVERGIRGGLSQVSKRYAKANNKYMSTYNPNLKSKYLMYFDINNQYGVAMSQPLPYGGFEWLGDIENFNLDIPNDSDTGYILEVDLKYPHSIHDAHSDLPFCPEHIAAPNSKDTKLLVTLHDKERYIIHYRNLKHALENGLELTKIHRILKFKQSPWLKAYIDLNTGLRQVARNEFEKNLFKLLNNAVYGKTMENVRNYSNVKLKTKWCGRYGIEALISSPMFKASMILEEELAIIELNKVEVKFNKPIYVGMCILDLAKLTIYDFHYNYMKPKFGNKARVCYTDTDSLVYEVECDDLYESIRNDANERFDTSEYEENNVYNIPRVNKKVLGMMHDENNGKIMSEFFGLRSKMYSTRVEGFDSVKRAKGVKSIIVKNSICFNDYLECLQLNKSSTITQHSIRSEKHIVNTLTQTKVGLCPKDDKRYICPDGIDTLAWGHYSIMEK